MKKFYSLLIAASIICSIPLTAYACEVYGSCGHLKNQLEQTRKPDNFIKKQKNDNPDFVAFQYAMENNISFEDAKNELHEKYGNPETKPQFKSRISNPLGLVPEEQQLLEAGIPLEVIKEGNNAIMKFIEENNITGYEEYTEYSET